MSRVKILVSIAAADWSYHPGQIVDIPEEQASTWIASGLAEATEPATAPTPAAKPPRKK
jgi:hypothetical protein